jgi:hypothetical protein
MAPQLKGAEPDGEEAKNAGKQKPFYRRYPGQAGASVYAWAGVFYRSWFRWSGGSGGSACLQSTCVPNEMSLLTIKFSLLPYKKEFDKPQAHIGL